MSSDRLQQILCHPATVAALHKLQDARTTAEDLHYDPWTFALEMASMLSIGCTDVSIGQQVGRFVGEGRWWPAGVDVGRGGSFHRLSFQRLPERPG